MHRQSIPAVLHISDVDGDVMLNPHPEGSMSSGTVVVRKFAKSARKWLRTEASEALRRYITGPKQALYLR